VADHADADEHQQVGHDDRHDVEGRREELEQHEDAGGDDEQRTPGRAVVPALAAEGHDVGREKRNERQHPEEGDRRDVLRHLVGHGQQHHDAAG